MNYKISHPTKNIKCLIDLPPSKSISNRLLIIKSLCKEDLKIKNLSLCDDTIVLKNGLKKNHGEIDIGHAGTSLRFLTAYFAIQKNREYILTGSNRVKERPIKELVDALRTLGAKIEYLQNEGFAPLKISGAELVGKEIEINGNIIGLQANMEAIKQKERFIDYDLNRIWQKKYFQLAIKNNQKNSELYELKKTHSIIETIIEKKKKNNITIVDLHNTSSQDGLFTIVSNENEEKIASYVEIPCITKLFSKVKGSLVQYYNSKGITSLVFEGGAINDPVSIFNHENGIYKILQKMKFIKENDIPINIIKEREQIKIIHKNKFSKHEVKYIHKIKNEDKFIMMNNITNFKNVNKNDIIGKDVNGEVRAPIKGKILMPLYQSQGSEGFYIIS